MATGQELQNHSQLSPEKLTTINLVQLHWLCTKFEFCQVMPLNFRG
ncbi:hypothetical protein PL9214650742 [Planktothrix tepida PCC 9214]|uniref:Uncharacterized protein n=1 Tax=Planktothrix tepida PCC 9214 TaxID=671072 RepID=A0A1J1LSC7_9CYAN|nr:hypothetical protein PL9214650742 [Planktothrix tepida PCC 9214]